MIYFKDLGLDTTGFKSSSLDQPVVTITDDMSRIRTKEEAFLASLPRCVLNVRQPDGSFKPVQGYLYTNKNGEQVCIQDPLEQRRLDLLDANVKVTQTMPLFGSGVEVPGVRTGYLDMLLKAQGSPEGRTRADNFGVSWDLSEFGGGDPFDQDNPPVLLSPEEISRGRRVIGNQLRIGGWDAEQIALARSESLAGDLTRENFLRAALATTAHIFAATTVPKDRERRAAGEGVRTHDPQDCLRIGLTKDQVPCCVQALRSGYGIESYVAAMTKQDPKVMTCLYEAQSAANKRKLMMVAGAVGAVVVGAALLKKRKK